MKENTLDVLFYLFDNFSEPSNSEQSREVLADHLEGAGYSAKNITQAFDWLESLADITDANIISAKKTSIRVFSKREKKWLNNQCQDYLHYLYNNAVLTNELREIVIDRVLVLRDINLNLDRLKWVVLMVLLNKPEAEAQYVWMDDVVLNKGTITYH